MKNIDEHLKDLTAKDEKKAQESADYLINSGDIALFSKLTDKMDYLFDFVRLNVCKRIEKAADKNNYKNIIKFFELYSPEFDDLFASILGKYADEDLTDELLELLENGSSAQKAYSAKYFSYIPDTIALDLLGEYAFSDNEELAFNSAQALGKMNDSNSYNKALMLLKNTDDFEKMKAVKFFTGYSKNPPLEDIFQAMKLSSMPENIAGEIPFLVSLPSIYNTDYKKNVLITVDNILNGLSEILPLAQIFQFELYEMTAVLIDENKKENHYHSKIAEILLKSLSKFRLFLQNDEYIFDEDKNTKQELADILKLLEAQSDNFWENQKKSVIKELSHCSHRIIAALEVIKDFMITDAIPEIIKLQNHENEIVICEAVSAVKHFEKLDELSLDIVLQNIKSDNIKAIIESYWN